MFVIGDFSKLFTTNSKSNYTVNGRKVKTPKLPASLNVDARTFNALIGLTDLAVRALMDGSHALEKALLYVRSAHDYQLNE